MAATGMRARQTSRQVNPTDITIYVGNPGPATPIVQVILNSAIVTETSGIGLAAVTVSFLPGANILELVVADGGLECYGIFLNANGEFQSSYYPFGADPLSSLGGGGPSNSSSSTTR